jgi:transposase-like protein
MTKAKQVRLVSWRLKVLQHATEGERRVAQTCRRFGISRKTFYRWKKRYETLGPTGVGDRWRRPQRSPGAERASPYRLERC